MKRNGPRVRSPAGRGYLVTDTADNHQFNVSIRARGSPGESNGPRAEPPAGQFSYPLTAERSPGCNSHCRSRRTKAETGPPVNYSSRARSGTQTISPVAFRFPPNPAPGAILSAAPAPGSCPPPPRPSTPCQTWACAASRTSAAAAIESLFSQAPLRYLGPQSRRNRRMAVEHPAHLVRPGLVSHVFLASPPLISDALFLRPREPELSPLHTMGAFYDGDAVQRIQSNCPFRLSSSLARSRVLSIFPISVNRALARPAR